MLLQVYAFASICFCKYMLLQVYAFAIICFYKYSIMLLYYYLNSIQFFVFIIQIIVIKQYEK